MCRVGVVPAVLIALLLTRPATGSPVDFARDIEPILADNCYACHGPDPGGRKAGLRLDLAAIAFAPLKDGRRPIVPGDSDRSELIRRVTSRDPDVRMPPSGHDPLAAAQIATLRRWIALGAVYRNHWSFEAPVRPDIPAVHRSDQARNPIDRFLLAALERCGLEFSPPATKTELLRRVTLDLTGLLPTPAQIDEFVADASPNAYENAVDRLLASPRYGEHRAHYWLDYVRYGDTHGLHNDNQRDIQPYRDWVIRAFNRNEPFDQFAVEQIAGDLLPPTNVDQIVATGFVRCNLSTGEGGAINEEIRVNNNRDRAEAYGTVFLGLTVGCAVCHDHKFDPTTQRDFYQLTAYFNNLAERPGNDDRFDPPPTIRIPTDAHRDEYNRVLRRRAEIQRRIDARAAGADSLVSTWLNGKSPPQRVSDEGLQLRFRFDEGAGTSVTNSAPNAEPRHLSFSGVPPVWGEQTWFWPSLRFEAATKLQVPRAGDFGADQPFSGGGWFRVRANPAAIGDIKTGALMARMDSGSKPHGWDLLYDDDSLVVDLLGGGAKDAIRVRTTAKFSRGEWHHFLFTYDGTAKASGVRIYADGVPQPVKILEDDLTGDIRTKVPWELGERHGSQEMKLARYQDIRLYRRELSPDEAARLPREDLVAEIVSHPPGDWSEDQRHLVTSFYLNDVDPPTRALLAKRAALDAKLETLSAGGELTMVCRERPELAYANVLVRGVYSARAERVRPDLPHFLPRPPGPPPRDRLGLARWTVSPENPLTARVTVNRMWQEVFGTGLVDTPGDFGLMGDRPSNADLLDWLAVEFRESGWDMKHMYRLMVTSEAYRQSSRITPELLELDPQNRLLARGPRFRMDAEMLRDIALQASGLLVEKIGGPAVHPYQPPGIWEAVRGLATKPGQWIQDHGPGTYRRSLYTFWKRQAPVPDMIAFDAPPRDVSCPRRERTDTPLQALVLWDDPQWLEASRVLAQNAMRSETTDDARLDFLSRRILSRTLDRTEKEIFRESLARFREAPGDPESLRKFLTVGDTPPDSSLPPAELRAWTLIASQLFCTDEALNK